MQYLKLKKIKKLYFGYPEIARALGIKERSARVSANRYVARGYLVRIKRNIYILRERWDGLSTEELFGFANLLQVPSYVSLMTALGYYEITTQIQRSYVESLAVKRTKVVEVGGRTFRFTRIDKSLYFGFSREKGFFIASPEKAFLDAAYLTVSKKYTFDPSSIDYSKLDMAKIKIIAKLYPKKTQEALRKYGYITKT